MHSLAKLCDVFGVKHFLPAPQLIVGQAFDRV